MAFTTWSPKSAYYNTQKKHGSSGCSGCSDDHPCDDCKDKDHGCGCCPAGLVEVRDPSDDKKVIGCLTPNDAEGYFLTVAPPPPGYVRLVIGGVFLGFVTPADYLELTAS